MTESATKTVNSVLGYTPNVPHWGYNGNSRRYWDFMQVTCLNFLSSANQYLAMAASFKELSAKFITTALVSTLRSFSGPSGMTLRIPTFYASATLALRALCQTLIKMASLVQLFTRGLTH